MHGLREIVGKDRVLTSPEDMASYAYDATPLLNHWPDAVALVSSVDQLPPILKLATETKTPVVPRGSGTGLSGGAIPIQGGVILQMTPMNKILELDEENLTVLVEPGVITSAIHEHVEARGLFYPPDPGSVAISTIGGNVAECAGGLRGLKYGVTKHYVLGLETVFPTGEVVWSGGKCVKDVAGYDLTGLLVGSEGTLGIFTKLLLKLIPKPESKHSLLAHFSRLEDAAATSSRIIADRIIPSTMEIIDKVVINCVEDYAKIGLPREAEAVLFIETDGPREAAKREIEAIKKICQSHGATQVVVAKSAEEGALLALARRSAMAALARVSPTTVMEDATVPRSQLAPMVRAIQEIAASHQLIIGVFGHAGDGNLHPTCLTDERNADEMKRVEDAYEEIFAAALDLGGTITGEHGVGLAKANYLPWKTGEAGLETMKRIKAAFDPSGIMNPGKIFPTRDIPHRRRLVRVPVPGTNC